MRPSAGLAERTVVSAVPCVPGEWYWRISALLVSAQGPDWAREIHFVQPSTSTKPLSIDRRQNPSAAYKNNSGEIATKQAERGLEQVLMGKVR